MAADLFFDWEPRLPFSGLVLREKGQGKAVVVWIGKRARPGRREHGLHDAWVGDRCVYRAADEFKVGQVVKC